MARQRRRGAAGKARHREIEAAPEEMHGAAFALEASAENIQHPVGLHELAPEPLCRLAIVGGVLAIALERNGVFDFRRHGPDPDVNIERMEALHDLGVEISDRARRQGEPFAPSVAHSQRQPVREKVEVDLHVPAPVRHRRRAQSAGGDVERDLPPVVHHGRQREPDLADHLRPQVQGRAGVLPLVEGELRPDIRSGRAAGWRVARRHLRAPAAIGCALGVLCTPGRAGRRQRRPGVAAPAPCSALSRATAARIGANGPYLCCCSEKPSA